MIHCPCQSQTPPAQGSLLAPQHCCLHETESAEIYFWPVLENFTQWLQTNKQHNKSLNDLLPHSHKIPNSLLQYSRLPFLETLPQKLFAFLRLCFLPATLLGIKLFLLLSPQPPHQNLLMPSRRLCSFLQTERVAPSSAIPQLALPERLGTCSPWSAWHIAVLK